MKEGAARVLVAYLWPIEGLVKRLKTTGFNH